MTKKSKKNLLNQALEFQMLPRLKLMGFSLIILGLCSLSYGYFSKLAPSESVLIPFEENSGFTPVENPPFFLTEEEKFQFYLIALVFGIIGTSCIATADYKKKKLNC